MVNIKLLKKQGIYQWQGVQYKAGIVYNVSQSDAQYLIDRAKVAIETTETSQIVPSMETESIRKFKDPKILKVALVRIGGLGDSLVLSILATAVKRKYPGCHTTLYVRDKMSYDVLVGNPSVDRVVMTKNGVWPDMVDKILTNGYDIVYDNRYSTKVYFADPERFKEEKAICDERFAPYLRKYNAFPRFNNDLSKEWTKTERELSLWSANLEGSDDDLFIHIGPNDCVMKALLEDTKYITIHNGADYARQTKCWTTDHWNTFVKWIKGRGYKVVQLGSKYEDVVEGVVDLTGKTTVQQCASLIEGACFHIDGEAGLVHLARAVRTRSIVLFGPTVLSFFQYDTNVNIESPAECRGCWWTTDMWWKDCPKGYEKPVPCMADIKPERVQLAVEEIEKMKPLSKHFGVDMNDVNEKFAMEMMLDEAHYKSEQCQWDRVHAMMDMCKGKKVLEVGAGDGYCVEYLQKKGFDVTGIEISKIRLARCQRKGLKVFHGDINHLPFDDNSFDTVMAGEILEHIPSVAQGLGELERVCKPNGKIITSIPIAPAFKKIDMHLWGIDHKMVQRNGVDDMLILAFERINGNEKGTESENVDS